MNLNKYIIDYNDSLINCIKKIELNKKRFIICVDIENKLKGTVTDGDIRRALIKGVNLEDRLIDMLNKSSEYLDLYSSFKDICEKFKSDKVEFLPILNEKKELINILTKKQFHILLLEDFTYKYDFDFSIFDKKLLEYEIYSKPWGFYKSTMLTSLTQAKIITVFPLEELSLQEHKHREEHWLILKGKGRVILGESEIIVYPGKYIYIPKGCKHKITNTGNENLIFSEVQLGDYFGEDDIIRYEDKYGRM